KIAQTAFRAPLFKRTPYSDGRELCRGLLPIVVCPLRSRPRKIRCRKSRPPGSPLSPVAWSRKLSQDPARPASGRKFGALLDRLEKGDVLVVSKQDRLGRNVVDVVTTVDKLAKIGVRVHCPQFGGTDLTSAAGRLTINVLSAVAQSERELL